MTLSLEEVRDTRFHLSRRSGYEVMDVDNFVDRVEATLGQLEEERDGLKRQISSLKSNQGGGGNSEELKRLRRENEELRANRSSESSQNNEELERLRRERRELAENAEKQSQRIARLEGDLERVNSENEQLRQAGDHSEALAAVQAEKQRLVQQNTQLQTQLRQAQEAARQPAPASYAPIDESGIQRIEVTTSEQAGPAIVRLVQLSTEQAERVVAEANASAAVKLEEAERKAHEIRTDAGTRAERIESEARVNAEKLVRDAQMHATQVEQEAAVRREELFSSLEADRDTLVAKVNHLREYEGTYRQRMIEHLQQQISRVESAGLAPEGRPALLSDSGSTTPRLDALMKRN